MRKGVESVRNVGKEGAVNGSNRENYATLRNTSQSESSERRKPTKLGRNWD